MSTEESLSMKIRDILGLPADFDLSVVDFSKAHLKGADLSKSNMEFVK